MKVRLLTTEMSEAIAPAVKNFCPQPGTAEERFETLHKATNAIVEALKAKGFQDVSIPFAADSEGAFCIALHIDGVEYRMELRPPN